jgi:hypothetical protein
VKTSNSTFCCHHAANSCTLLITSETAVEISWKMAEPIIHAIEKCHIFALLNLLPQTIIICPKVYRHDNSRGNVSDFIQEVSASNVRRENKHSDWRLLWFSSVPPGKRRVTTYIKLGNSRFLSRPNHFIFHSHLVIRSYLWRSKVS